MTSDFTLCVALLEMSVFKKKWQQLKKYPVLNDREAVSQGIAVHLWLFHNICMVPSNVACTEMWS